MVHKAHDKKMHPEELRKMERRMRISEYIVERGGRGYSLHQMAKDIGCSFNTLKKDIEYLYEEYEAFARDAQRMMQRERGITVMRLEQAQRFNMQTMLDESLPIQDRINASKEVTKVETVRAKLFGMNMPTKHALTTPDGEGEYTGIPIEAKKRMLMAQRVQRQELEESEEAEVVVEAS